MKSTQKRIYGFLACILAAGLLFALSACSEPGSDPLPTVTGVTVSAAEGATSVDLGGTLQFNAVVNGTDNPSQSVTWTIETPGTAEGTSISASGLLSVDQEETAPVLTVKATSDQDSSKSGIYTVAVRDGDKEDPEGELSIDTGSGGTPKVGTELSANYEPGENENEDDVTYQWYKDGEPIEDATDSTYTPDEAGSYTVAVKVGDSNPKMSGPITVESDGPAFTAVTDITGVPAAATAGIPLALTGTAVPNDATNKTITWTVKSAGTTGATIIGSMLHTTASGTATVTATIANGTAQGAAYVKDFVIIVSGGPGPEISGSAPLVLDIMDITDAPAIPPITISRSGSNDIPVTFTITLDNPSQYDSIEWEVAGVGVYADQTITESGESFTLDAEEVTYNAIATHFLYLTVVINGMPYTKVITFTIEL